MPDDAALARWLAEWVPPTKPFDLAPHVRVTDPALFIAYHRQHLAARGQVRRGVWATVRRCWELFGEHDHDAK